MSQIRISRDFVREAAAQPAVRKQLGVIARRVANQAESIAGREGVRLNTWVVEGTRPEWRPQAVVYGDNAEQEWGSSRMQRRRIMGRAAEESA